MAQHGLLTAPLTRLWNRIKPRPSLTAEPAE